MKLNNNIVVLLIILIVVSCNFLSLNSAPIVHNIKFEQEGNFWIIPSEMHDSLSIQIEFAESDSEMMQGLMHRKTMAENQGMLFIYQYPQEMNFWMKNTHIPLDLIFIDEHGTIVDLYEGATPFSEKNISSSVLSKFVLEINAGYCEKNYIICGDKVKWEKIKK